MNTVAAKGLIFDLDGTLVDSHRAVEQAWARWYDRHGIPLSDVLAICHGVRSEETIRRLAPQLDVAVEADWLEAVERSLNDSVTARSATGTAGSACRYNQTMAPFRRHYPDNH